MAAALRLARRLACLDGMLADAGRAATAATPAAPPRNSRRDRPCTGALSFRVVTAAPWPLALADGEHLGVEPGVLVGAHGVAQPGGGARHRLGGGLAAAVECRGAGDFFCAAPSSARLVGHEGLLRAGGVGVGPGG